MIDGLSHFFCLDFELEDSLIKDIQYFILFLVVLLDLPHALLFFLCQFSLDSFALPFSLRLSKKFNVSGGIKRAPLFFVTFRLIIIV